MIAYCLKAVVCSALLLAFYHLFLERETMHRFKRFYLLLSLVFPWLVPSITIKSTAEILPIPVLGQTELFISQTIAQPLTATAVPTATQPNDYYTVVVFVIYILISTFLLFRFFLQIRQLFISLSGKQKFQYDTARIVIEDKPVATHSFLHFIFISKQDYLRKEQFSELLLHELAHVKQRHSIDIIFVELLQSFLWFNPLLPLYKKAVRLNHEFLADEAVLKNNNNVPAYQHMLLSTINKTNQFRLSSSINFLLTKKRLVMMTKKTHRYITYAKQLISVTLLAALVFLFSDQSFAQHTNGGKNEKKESPQTDSLKPMVSVFGLTLPTTVEGVSAEQMAEYARIRDKALMPSKRDIVTYNFNNYSTADREFLENTFLGMNEKQRAVAILHFVKPNPPFPKTILTQEKFEALKSPAVYGIWIDEKRVNNKALDKYKASDFSSLNISKLYGAAKKGRSYTHQANLSTNAYYEDYYKKAISDTSYAIMIMPVKAK